MKSLAECGTTCNPCLFKSESFCRLAHFFRNAARATPITFRYFTQRWVQAKCVVAVVTTITEQHGFFSVSATAVVAYILGKGVIFLVATWYNRQVSIKSYINQTTKLAFGTGNPVGWVAILIRWSIMAVTASFLIYIDQSLAKKFYLRFNPFSYSAAVV